MPGASVGGPPETVTTSLAGILLGPSTPRPRCPWCCLLAEPARRNLPRGSSGPVGSARAARRDTGWCVLVRLGRCYPHGQSKPQPEVLGVPHAALVGRHICDFVPLGGARNGERSRSMRRRRGFRRPSSTSATACGSRRCLVRSTTHRASCGLCRSQPGHHRAEACGGRAAGKSTDLRRCVRGRTDRYGVGEPRATASSGSTSPTRRLLGDRSLSCWRSRLKGVHAYRRSAGSERDRSRRAASGAYGGPRRSRHATSTPSATTSRSSSIPRSYGADGPPRLLRGPASGPHRAPAPGAAAGRGTESSDRRPSRRRHCPRLQQPPPGDAPADSASRFRETRHQAAAAAAAEIEDQVQRGKSLVAPAPSVLPPGHRQAGVVRLERTRRRRGPNAASSRAGEHRRSPRSLTRDPCRSTVIAISWSRCW